ncbi:MAG: hypothetical protein R3F11_02855 [Verrucomicrobiales bacterium]
MYDIEHVELFQSIRAGKPINDGDRMATSTMAGIFGRMASHRRQDRLGSGGGVETRTSPPTSRALTTKWTPTRCRCRASRSSSKAGLPPRRRLLWL